jgi:four helix bundle protein
MSYKNLDVWQLACSLVVDIHNMTLDQLPKFEMFEEGSQIRRSVKSIRSNIVEGYGRREYKQEFVRFITFALASSIETQDHLETLWETGSLSDQNIYDDLHARLEILGKKLNLFRRSVQENHLSAK